MQTTTDRIVPALQKCPCGGELPAAPVTAMQCATCRRMVKLDVAPRNARLGSLAPLLVILALGAGIGLFGTIGFATVGMPPVKYRVPWFYFIAQLPLLFAFVSTYRKCVFLGRYAAVLAFLLVALDITMLVGLIIVLRR